MIRVLHVYKTYYPDSFGGIEQAIRHMANGGLKYGVEATVFAPSVNPAASSFDFESHKVMQARTDFTISSTPFSASAISLLNEVKTSFDIVHFHLPNPFGDLLKIFPLGGIPSVATYHSDIIRQKLLKYVYSPIQKKFLDSVNCIVCTSPAYLKTSKVLQKYHAKVETVLLGLDAKSFPKCSKDNLSLWKKRFPNKFFLFLGALRDYKGVDTLLHAAKNLKADLVIAGGGGNIEKVKKIAASTQSDNVHFLGQVSEHDKIALLELCTGLVLPSHFRNEAFGLVQLEAAMRGKPLICTELGTGTSYVNKHGVTGLVVPPKNHEALSNAMNFFIFQPNIAARMGQQAKNRFEMLFTADDMCEKYSKIYQKLAG